ncbi:hypothetical protein SAMN05421776_105339 [Nocardia farcinica]|uniref:Uncharacterized protein n=1 Tax=Nocardia farcinica TaxID=37329 RepID=A0A0H5NEF8_NOCFR|nr:hypothetical protein [Nocardia farcinica]AXK88870.1 hypothetical protein DXT66_27460 [Nocardia farcinica]PFX04000.1 hypothetical protein CJ469_01874 [Nocardia farcinica]PFX10158.1 hypothetical protein CJ468_01005 [Nocardia farcinica]CRY73699.1 Uncharacterised protein [Nocardia farcinica]SIT24765.1 hypothetical protein SAMN05421776_105339 [Nocardia farcinica]
MPDTHELAEVRRPFGGVFIGKCACGFETMSVRKRKHAVRGVERHIAHATAPPRPACPSKGKRKFRTREAAETSLSTIWQRGRPGSRLPSRAYLCPCGHWHLTKNPPSTAPHPSTPSPTRRETL